jgi:transcriptional regulator with XRE-family HTH domain
MILKGGISVAISRKENEPHPIDVYVGGRMRLRRIQLGLSQGALASKIGVSFQAVQKYESGDIRISASREIMALIRGYYGIRDPHLQADILRLISKLGNRANDEL